MKTLDHTLEHFAANQVDDAAVEDAQRKLEALIATKSPRPRRAVRAGGWLVAATSAAVVALVVLMLPLAPTPALGFSAVQKQLRDFRTLSFNIEQRVNGQDMLRTHVAMTNEGNVRTEVGDEITVIVNSAEKRVLLLMKSARVAIVKPLLSPVEQDDQLAWLKEIREFQGVATRLPESRIIDGQKAYGWQLSTDGMELVVWATEEGVPLQMSMNPGGAQMELVFHFQMDLPLSPAMFSTQVPAGYSLGKPED
jgi:hypothetical protein